ncbi:MAG: hypothetical protein BHW48_02985 [Roseburia sp. CAG:10041_57]|jgi:hypothetical protein|nr:MAG: hypothetical protein BHW48_02985 [Roseburia sp. CAG:10041_57]
METLIARDCIYKNGKIYFFSEIELIPTVIDVNDNSVTLLKVKNSNDFRRIQFDLVTELNGKMYALEKSGKYICEYDIQTERVRYIQIDCDRKSDANFALIYSENSCIYIFDRTKELTIYNIQSDEIMKVLYPTIDDEIMTGCKSEEQIFLFTKEGKNILVYDTKTKKWENIYTDWLPLNIIHAVEDDGKIYVLSEDGTVVRWNKENEITIIEKAQEWYNSEKAACRLCITHTKIVVLPSLSEDILVLGKHDFSMEVMQTYPKEFKYKNYKCAKYYGYSENTDSCYFACRASHYILKIDKHKNVFTWIRSQISKEKLFEYQIKKEVIQERTKYLEFYLEYVKNKTK